MTRPPGADSARLRLALIGWVPLVAALAVAAAFARAVVTAALTGSGGVLLLPAEADVAAPAATRVRRVHRPRAPDSPEPGRAR